MQKTISVISVIVTTFISSVYAADDPKITVGGFIKFDSYYDSSVNNSVGPRGYDLLNFRSIPLDGTASAERAGGTKMHARESRFYINSETPFEGKSIKTSLEFDLLGRIDTGSGTDDDTVSNSYEPRLRQAWISWDNWLVGQTWTNFVDLGAFPEGMTLSSLVGRSMLRQAQIRYTKPLGGGDKLVFSLENPDTDFNLGTPAPGSNASEDDSIPDIVGTYFNKTDFGHVRASFVFRRLGVDTVVTDGIGNGVSDSTVGWGIGLSSKINFSKSLNMKLNLHGGDGIGRYIYSNPWRAAILTSEGKLETETTWAGNFMLQYKLDKMRYNLGYGVIDVDVDEDLTVGSVNQKITTLHANAIYTIAPSLNIGAGITQASRTVVSGDEGDITRLHFYVKKSFKAIL
jgi:hypothetical protein